MCERNFATFIDEIEGRDGATSDKQVEIHAESTVVSNSAHELQEWRCEPV
jgi:hypothetical protein